MSEEKLSYNVISIKDIFIICNYDYDGKTIYPNKIREARHLFSDIIPSIKTEGDDPLSIFYPIDELRIKQKIQLYEGDRSKLSETGIGYHYHYMGSILETGKNIKRLHEIVHHNIDRLKIFDKCQIVWGEEDGDISSSIHEFKPFGKLKGWKELKLSDDILKENEIKFKKKYDKS
ncbi:hypothetical protein LCGC14_1063300 [marine sediment metagenome]|uniref:Uncharacterized protein n=1 Tax=marine sediment metagenome TaxID=412755 RepID=A0A0F9N7F7_9ZZZZ|nr:hypothetical protein [bacterium]